MLTACRRSVRWLKGIFQRWLILHLFICLAHDASQSSWRQWAGIHPELSFHWIMDYWNLPLNLFSPQFNHIQIDTLHKEGESYAAFLCVFSNCYKHSAIRLLNLDQSLSWKHWAWGGNTHVFTPRDSLEKPNHVPAWWEETGEPRQNPQGKLEELQRGSNLRSWSALHHLSSRRGAQV